MAFKVVYSSTVPIAIDRNAFARLGVDYVEKPAPTEDDVIALASDADVLVARSEPVTRRVITALTSCRFIFTPKVGYENIDVAAATEMGICVANMPGLSAEEVSDHALALLFALARRIVRLDRMVHEGRWQVLHGTEMQDTWKGISQVRGQTLGLIGFGAIARALASKAMAFGLRLIAHDPYVKSEVFAQAGVEGVSLARLLAESDYVSLHSPLTHETHHLMGHSQFQAMKPSAYLINTSRGGLVNEEALREALTRRRIAGAALDVMETEPVCMDNPLLAMDSVILTGHSAHYSDHVWAEQARRPADEVARVMAGQWPLGWINREVETNYLARWGTRAKR